MDESVIITPDFDRPVDDLSGQFTAIADDLAAICIQLAIIIDTLADHGRRLAAIESEIAAITARIPITI